jgi:hypothetical protein
MARLAAICAALILFGLWFGDRVGWEGDDLASMFGISYLDMVGRENVYRYSWQPLSYEISYWVSKTGIRFLDLTYLANVLGMLGLGLLIGLSYAGINQKSLPGLLAASALVISFPELWMTALYFNSTALALPFFVSSLYCLQRVRSWDDSWSIFASGLFFGICCLVRMDFAAAGLFILAMIYLMQPGPGIRPYFHWFIGAMLVPVAVLVANHAILRRMFHILGSFKGESSSWPITDSINILLLAVGPAMFVVPLLLVKSSALIRFPDFRLRSAIFVISLLPMFIPLIGLFSGKYLVPLFCCLIWAISREIGKRTMANTLPSNWMSRVYLAVLLVAAGFVVTPFPGHATARQGLIERSVGPPQPELTHDGVRTFGGYIHLASWFRNDANRQDYLSIFQRYAEFIDDCSRSVTLIYPRNVDSYLNNSWTWGFVPLHLSQRGWRLLTFNPVDEVLMVSPESDRMLRIVAIEHYNSTPGIEGETLDLETYLNQPAPQTDFSENPPTKKAELMVWGMINSGICGTGREPNSF